MRSTHHRENVGRKILDIPDYPGGMIEIHAYGRCTYKLGVESFQGPGKVFFGVRVNHQVKYLDLIAGVFKCRRQKR
jgi:hypothetical protein